MDDITFNIAMEYIASRLERIALALESIDMRT